MSKIQDLHGAWVFGTTTNEVSPQQIMLQFVVTPFSTYLSTVGANQTSRGHLDAVHRKFQCEDALFHFLVPMNSPHIDALSLLALRPASLKEGLD